MTAEELVSAIILRTVRSASVLVLAAVAAALLLGSSPGSDVDEREMVGRMSNESIQEIREQRARIHAFFPFALRFVKDLVQGHTPVSEIYAQPVSLLISERFNTTADNLIKGLLFAWSAALIIALIVSSQKTMYPALTAIVSTAILLSVPSAVVAVLCLLMNFPPFVAIAAVVFPRVFPVLEEEFREARTSPHVIFARAKGLTPARVFYAHVIPSSFAPVVALAGVSVVFAVGASIPIEALLDSPGLGQLTWNAAVGRDLPLLVTTTLMITAATILLNWCVDLALLAGRLRSI